MAIPYLTNIDLNGNQVLNVRAQNLATDPSPLGAGQYWYNTTTKKFSFYDGTEIHRFVTEAELTEALSGYQAKITASGILKGDGQGGVSAAQAGVDYQAPLTFDEAPTEGSNNPVKSGGIFTALEGKQDNLSFDTAPVEGSSNPVTSGGVYTAVAGANTAAGNALSAAQEAKGAADAAQAAADAAQQTADGKQANITAQGILKGDGAGGVTAAVAGTDYQAPITVTADRALVSDANGKVAASAVTATELGYLAGVTAPIQGQLDNIPKYNYLNGVEVSVADGADQATINAAAIDAIEAQYTSPAKWDAVVVDVTFATSDVQKDAVYFYNGSEWIFLYYVSTGIQVANGAVAGIVESSDDITFAAGKGTVLQAGKLKSAVEIGLTGVTATAASFDGSQGVNINVTAVPAGLITDVLGVAHGGTGAATLPAGQVLIGNGTGAVGSKAIDTQVTDNSDNLVTSGAVAAALGMAGNVNKYSEKNPSLTPAGGICTWTVNHNLGTQAVMVSVAETASPYREVMVDIAKTSTNAVTISFISNEAVAADKYTVTVLG